METREKSGDSQNSASAAARWTRRSGRSRSLTPSTSSPPMWSMCKWVRDEHICFWAKADVPDPLSKSANDPKRTYGHPSCEVLGDAALILDRPPAHERVDCQFHT